MSEESSHGFPYIPEAAIITKDQFDAALALYEEVHDYVVEDYDDRDLLELDRLRFIELPRLVEIRKIAGEAWVEKEELDALVRWKSNRGRNPSKDDKKAAKNDRQAVMEITKAAFKVFTSSSDPDYFVAIQELQKLKGISFSMATLLLSIHSPDIAPFMAEELFAWACWNPQIAWRCPDSSHYSADYLALQLAVRGIKQRLEGVNLLELEKVAFVCARMAVQPYCRESVEECLLNSDRAEGEDEGSDWRWSSTELNIVWGEERASKRVGPSVWLTAKREIAKESAARHKNEEVLLKFAGSKAPAPNSLPKASTVTKEQIEVTLPLYDQVFSYLWEEDRKKKYDPDVGKYMRMDRERYGWIARSDDSMNVRKQSPDGPFINKEDLEMLMEWKLWVTCKPCHMKHGKFRPNLQQLVAANSEEDVIDTTRAAFKTYSSSEPPSYKEALKMLGKLKGVGPATASLVLSVYSPTIAPFFSDELFRWVCWDEKAGWKQQIKYDMKEYNMLWKGVQGLREKLGDVDALALEKVAFVCGKMTEDAKIRRYVEEELKKEGPSKVQEKLAAIREENGEMAPGQIYDGKKLKLLFENRMKKLEAMVKKILDARKQRDGEIIEPTSPAPIEEDAVESTAKEDLNSDLDSPAGPTGSLAKKARGRPKGLKSHPPKTKEDQAETSSREDVSTGQDPSAASVIEKGRGRPKRSVAPTLNVGSINDANPNIANTKRPLGRPKKTSPVLSTATLENGRPRGRPEKAAPPDPITTSDDGTEPAAETALPIRKGRGRPKKDQSQESLAAISPPPVKSTANGKEKISASNKAKSMKDSSIPIRATRSRTVVEDKEVEEAVEESVRKRVKRKT